VALMLEVNPDLGWRDVQAILVQTSRRLPNVNQTPNGDPTAQTNGGVFIHSNQYGYGVVDALAAVEAAECWENLGPELKVEGSSGTLNILIEDYPDPAVSNSITLSDDSLPDLDGDFVIENVVVFADVKASTRGHLRVVLTAPSGMESILWPGLRPENIEIESELIFQTVRHWYEDVNGQWTLSIQDTLDGDLDNDVTVAAEDNMLVSWRMKVYGHEEASKKGENGNKCKAAKSQKKGKKDKKNKENKKKENNARKEEKKDKKEKRRTRGLRSA
jgi:subtilisin-like proprotein convertase family protein